MTNYLHIAIFMQVNIILICILPLAILTKGFKVVLIKLYKWMPNTFPIGNSISSHICWYHALNMILITNQISKTYHTIKITTSFNLYHLAIQYCFRLQKTWLWCNTSQKMILPFSSILLQRIMLYTKVYLIWYPSFMQF